MSESTSTELTNTAYDILKVLGKDADFLYDTIDKYIKDAQNANRQDLVEMWQIIKKDRLKHIHMLKEALEKRDPWLTISISRYSLIRIMYFFSLSLAVSR